MVCLCNQVIGNPIIFYPVAHVMKNLAGAAEKTAWVAGNVASSVANGIQTTMHGMKNAFDFEKLDKIDNAIDTVKKAAVVAPVAKKAIDAVQNASASGNDQKSGDNQVTSTKKPKAATPEQPTETPSDSSESDTKKPTTETPVESSDSSGNAADTLTSITTAAPPSV